MKRNGAEQAAYIGQVQFAVKAMQSLWSWCMTNLPLEAADCVRDEIQRRVNAMVGEMHSWPGESSAGPQPPRPSGSGNGAQDSTHPQAISSQQPEVQP